MGRWQNKVEKVRLSPQQNLLNTDKDCSVGFVVAPNEHTVNFSIDCEKTDHQYLVNSNGLPLHHYSEEPHGDTTWIMRRLKRVAQHKRAELADEYAHRYLLAYTEEASDIKKENKARKNANLWLLQATKHTSQKC
ncbi:MAG: hypothetical protein ACI843_001325 [Psychrobacter glaciei]|jgi:hypothetical protein